MSDVQPLSVREWLRGIVASTEHPHDRATAAAALTHLEQLRVASQRLLDAVRDHGDVVGQDGHVWNAWWALQYLLEGKAPDGSDLPETR
jgi:hypothetical protein